MKYRIITIIEPDYGCEGIPDKEEKMDTVVIEADNGERISIKYSDSELYRLSLNEGSYVCLNGKELTPFSC